ncbi:hypothetical protein O159_15670 [Leifsonia xyli subsp. cynodontis DSM 46306]|uniref:Uncharacterized protein n=1 Tax=Leifsonia xyli subsp. cynodontis DSM 46306 TaxID=1389489 RepID=U3PDJ3_LEIXC|nr:hypothetical protein [Leifsonia xyli]AGW41618.1 hypothetical protein O159_15670 [Leifsonia xyli subsp. cynodontis DSM 46306]
MVSQSFGLLVDIGGVDSALVAFVAVMLLLAFGAGAIMFVPHTQPNLIVIALLALLSVPFAVVMILTTPPLIVARSWDEPMWLRTVAVFAFCAAIFEGSVAAVLLVSSASLVTALPILLAAGALILNALLLANRDSYQRAAALESRLSTAIIAVRTPQTEAEQYAALFHLCATIRRLEKGGRFVPTPRPLSEPLRAVLLYAIQHAAPIGRDLLAPAQERQLQQRLKPEIAAASLPALLERLHSQLLDGQSPRSETETKRALRSRRIVL